MLRLHRPHSHKLIPFGEMVKVPNFRRKNFHSPKAGTVLIVKNATSVCGTSKKGKETCASFVVVEMWIPLWSMDDTGLVWLERPYMCGGKPASAQVFTGDLGTGRG